MPPIPWMNLKDVMLTKPPTKKKPQGNLQSSNTA